MTRLTPLWSQDGSYPASTDRQLIRAIWPGGGFPFGMAPSVVPETMQIQIDAGSVAIPGADVTHGGWLCVSDAAERVAIATAPPSGQNRTDLVVAGPIVDGPNPAWAFQAVPGNPGSASPAPAPPAPAGTVPVCSINVAGGSAVLSPAGLTDLRGAASGGARAINHVPEANSGFTFPTTYSPFFVADATITFTKRRDDSRLILALAATFEFSSGTAPANVFFGLQIGGVNRRVTLLRVSSTLTRNVIAGQAEYLRPAGTFSIVPVCATQFGSTVLTWYAGNDFLSYSVIEAGP